MQPLLSRRPEDLDDLYVSLTLLNHFANGEWSIHFNRHRAEGEGVEAYLARPVDEGMEAEEVDADLLEQMCALDTVIEVWSSCDGKRALRTYHYSLEGALLSMNQGIALRRGMIRPATDAESGERRAWRLSARVINGGKPQP